MKTARLYTAPLRHLVFLLILVVATVWVGCGEEGEIETDTDTIYIDDTALEDVYYHELSYDHPTVLIFRNLTTATNSVYFHKCVNIKEVHFPNLVSIGDISSGNPYFYFHQNQGLEKVNAPKLATVYGYVYFWGNSSLDLSSGICGIEDVYSRGDPDEISCMDPRVDIVGNANNDACFSAVLHPCN